MSGIGAALHRRSGKRRIQEGFEFGFPSGDAYLLADNFSTLENQKPRDAGNAVLGGEFLVGHNVKLPNLRFAVVLVGQLVQYWRDHFARPDRKSTRLNSSHGYISYAVFC